MAHYTLNFHAGLFLCSFIFLNIRHSHSLPSPVNCSNHLGIEELSVPSVKVYDASEETPNYAKNGTVILKPALYEGNTLGWIGLECYHNKSIRWVYNLNILQAGLADTYSVTARDIGDFYDISSYEFRAELELQIHAENLNFVLICASFENPCERSVVEVNYDRNEKKYILKSLSKSDENIPLVTELERAVVKNSNWGQTFSENSSCTVKFSLFDEGEGEYHHLWIPQTGNKIDPRRVPDRQNLENIYLFSEHLSQSCITDQCRTNKRSCNNAKKDSEKNKFWPLVFFMAGGKNLSRVVHAYQTLITRNDDDQDGRGRLRFAWEYSNPKDFLVMENLRTDGNSTIYMGQPITIKCHMSPFLFSFGTQIGYLSITASADNIIFINEIEEDTIINATRVAVGKLTFPFSYIAGKIKIFCFAPIWNSSTEWVNVSREYDLIEPKVSVYGTTGIKSFVLSLNTAFSTSCKASGSPIPFLTVNLPENTTRVQLSETIGNDSRQVDIAIDAVDESHAGFYNCVATNFRGASFYEFEIKIKTLSISEATTSTLTIALISVFGSISVIFLAVVIFLLVRFRMEKAEFRRLTEEAVREFFEGLEATQVPTGDESGQHVYANDSVKAQPYDTKYEVSHKNWSLSSTILGTGAFAMVRKGCVDIGGRKSVIAVKTMKSGEDIDDFKATLLELKIMSTIGHHRHIVKLMAASTDEIQNRKVLIGVEFCANGSLLTYLQKRKKLFTNLVNDGRIQFQLNANKENDTSNVEEGAYMNLVTSDISTIDLFKWSFQIASGMDFLESKKVLHADLAARNILLTDELLVKISDFGLSRELFENSEYTKKTQVVLPFKWMAPESLKWLKFSIKSDVWSYGVTLHEVFTLGDEPYPGQTWSEEFITSLENGMRLQRPPFCTENVYTQVMMRCWQAEPQDRIRFADAMSFFEKAIGFLTSSARNSEECRDFC